MAAAHKVLHLLFKFVYPFPEEITQFSDEVKMGLISQLSKAISRVL